MHLALASEELIDGRESYGLTFKDLVIDFDKKEATLTVMNRIVLGLDRPLIDRPVTIRASSPDFQNLINHLNFTIRTIYQVCITDQFELLYAALPRLTIRNQDK
jgi:hypothetical protein